MKKKQNSMFATDLVFLLSMTSSNKPKNYTETNIIKLINIPPPMGKIIYYVKICMDAARIYALQSKKKQSTSIILFESFFENKQKIFAIFKLKMKRKRVCVWPSFFR